MNNTKSTSAQIFTEVFASSAAVRLLAEYGEAFPFTARDLIVNINAALDALEMTAEVVVDVQNSEMGIQLVKVGALSLITNLGALSVADLKFPSVKAGVEIVCRSIIFAFSDTRNNEFEALAQLLAKAKIQEALRTKVSEELFESLVTGAQTYIRFRNEGFELSSYSIQDTTFTMNLGEKDDLTFAGGTVVLDIDADNEFVDQSGESTLHAA